MSDQRTLYEKDIAKTRDAKAEQRVREIRSEPPAMQIAKLDDLRRKAILKRTTGKPYK